MRLFIRNSSQADVNTHLKADIAHIIHSSRKAAQGLTLIILYYSRGAVRHCMYFVPTYKLQLGIAVQLNISRGFSKHSVGTMVSPWILSLTSDMYLHGRTNF